MLPWVQSCSSLGRDFCFSGEEHEVTSWTAASYHENDNCNHEKRMSRVLSYHNFSPSLHYYSLQYKHKILFSQLSVNKMPTSIWDWHLPKLTPTVTITDEGVQWTSESCVTLRKLLMRKNVSLSYLQVVMCWSLIKINHWLKTLKEVIINYGKCLINHRTIWRIKIRY